MIFIASIPANQKQFVLLCFITALLFHFVAAILSVGYYYADEQYQVIEFAGYKLGTHTANELAWEFKYQLRSGFLPVFCSILLTVLKTVGLTNPFNQAIALRLFAAIISLTASLYVITTFVNNYKTQLSQRTFIFCALLLWFFPFLDVRFASETFAAALFIIAFCKLNGSATFYKASYSLIVLIAAVILIRYQMLLPFSILILWNFIYNKNHSAALHIVAGIVLSFIVGFVIDYYFYGSLTVPLYNYSKMIVTGSGPDFGNEPWHFYFNAIALKSFLPLGILLLISFLFHWIKNPKSMLTWLTLSYFLLHCLLPHKELRFLFPMLFFCPIVVACFLRHIESLLKSKPAVSVLKVSLIALVVINIAIEAIAIAIPANSGIAIANYLDKNTATNTVVIHPPYCNPYSPFESLPIKFYSDKKINQVKIETASFLPDSILNIHSKQFLSLRSADYELYKPYLTQKGFDLIYGPVHSDVIKIATKIGFDFNDNMVLLER